MSFGFGSFEGPCATSALVVCPLLGSNNVGMSPICYSRNYEWRSSGFFIFQPAALVIRLCILPIAGVMVFHVKSKYTAVGRTEFATFFYLYLLATLLELLLNSNLIPIASIVYKYFAAISVGITIATFWALLVNAFIPFQFYADGSAISLWGTRLSCLAVACASSFVAYATFRSQYGFSRDTPTVLWMLYFIFPAICAIIYIISQICLVLQNLQDRWPLGDLFFAVSFFGIGQAITLGLSNQICEGTKHYLDGTFFGTVSTLLAVMFIYKYWDSITKEDLEYTVGGGKRTWAVLEDEEEDIEGDAMTDYSSSSYYASGIVDDIYLQHPPSSSVAPIPTSRPPPHPYPPPHHPIEHPYASYSSPSSGPYIEKRPY
ncbi:MAG: chitin synthase export chaperone [Piptocephalis tieghemiana]|nr:MAG: chitin synthase export chaperone [Piptocephalis tieghemiana]